MAPSGLDSNAIVVPDGCTGLSVTNSSGDLVYISPDTSDLDSGRGLPVGETWEFAIAGSPSIFLNKPNSGAGVVYVIRYAG